MSEPYGPDPEPDETPQDAFGVGSRQFSLPLDWTGAYTRSNVSTFKRFNVQTFTEITREDIDALDEGELRAILGNVAQVANAYPYERTARTLWQEVRFHRERVRIREREKAGVLDSIIPIGGEYEGLNKETSNA